MSKRMGRWKSAEDEVVWSRWPQGF